MIRSLVLLIPLLFSFSTHADHPRVHLKKGDRGGLLVNDYEVKTKFNLYDDNGDKVENFEVLMVSSSSVKGVLDLNGSMISLELKPTVSNSIDSNNTANADSSVLLCGEEYFLEHDSYFKEIYSDYVVGIVSEQDQDDHNKIQNSFYVFKPSSFEENYSCEDSSEEGSTILSGYVLEIDIDEALTLTGQYEAWLDGLARPLYVQ